MENMLTLETMKKDYGFVKGGSQCYHNMEVFDGFGKFCDVYFNCENGQVKEEQISIYNTFKAGLKKYANEIEVYIQSSLTTSEQKKPARINEAVLQFNVVDVPFENPKYDLILICGKDYKGFLGMRNEISIRVEIKDGSIQSIQRKRNVLKDND
jgi:hypothetical protein